MDGGCRSAYSGRGGVRYFSIIIDVSAEADDDSQYL